MCLSIKNGTKKRTAKEDIIVYKQVSIIPGDAIKTGDTFTGVIKEIACSGKLSVVANNVFFCTNNRNLCGYSISGSDRLGFKYSWVLDSNVKLHKTFVNSSVVPIAELFSKFETIYRAFPVKLGKTYTSPLVRESYGQVEIGLHSYKDILKCSNGVTIECIIPKGSKYYIGDFSRDVSYASDRLTYVKVVKN